MERNFAEPHEKTNKITQHTHTHTQTENGTDIDILWLEREEGGGGEKAFHRLE